MLFKRLTSSIALSAVFLNNSPRNSFHALSKNSTNIFNFGICEIPHPEKAYKGGEDAVFADKNILFVADGVGGWAEMGIDPAKYSKTLCRNVEMIWKQNIEKYLRNPKLLIIDSEKKTKEIGSSTVCILTLNEEIGLLYSSYIGDSGYAIFRENNEKNGLEIVFKSEEQTRAFNFPYQIGFNGDPPQRAIELKHKVEGKEIVVVGTDGLWDNLDIEQIKNVIYPLIKEEKEMKTVAEELAKKAFVLSLDPKYNSPFSISAKKNNLRFLGGKSDDITVIVAEINLKS